MDKTTGVPQSGFCGTLQVINNLEVSEWLFQAGMLFGSTEKWWGDRGTRRAPHEGLDICYYRTPAGKAQDLCSGMQIPLLYDGELVRVVNDFLGMTVFVRHCQFGSAGEDFYTIYGHVIPLPGLSPGTHLGEGAVIGALAGCGDMKPGPPPHLHLSAAWIATETETMHLGWDLVSGKAGVRLVDPITLINCRHSIFLPH